MSSPLKRKAPPKNSLVLVNQKVLSDETHSFMYKWKDKYLVPVSINEEEHMIGISIKNGQREPSMDEMEEVLRKLGMLTYDSHTVERDEGFYIHFFCHVRKTKKRPRA